jgi:hypothetical protein
MNKLDIFFGELTEEELCMGFVLIWQQRADFFCQLVKLRLTTKILTEKFKF